MSDDESDITQRLRNLARKIQNHKWRMLILSAAHEVARLRSEVNKLKGKK